MAQTHHLDRLTAIDASFLHQEGESSHMHVGAVMIFEGPPPALRRTSLDHIRARLHLVPRYRQKLAFPPLETGRPLWVDDPSFNLEYHVRHTALPEPGSEEQLRSLAARIFSQQLDRAKPLWEMWLVQGLEGNRFALISKTHHALVDGISGRRPRDRAVRRSSRCRRRSPIEGEPWAAAPRAVAASTSPRAGCAGSCGRRSSSPAARPRRRAARHATLESSARGARGRRRGRVGGAQPGARDAAQRRDRPAPPLRVRARRARRLQARQERVRRHGQRRRADGRVGRRCRTGCARAACAPRASSCARSSRSRSAPRSSAAASATSSRPCAGRCRSTSRTRSRG